MTTNQKLLWGGLGLLALISVCCFGMFLGSALSRPDRGRSVAPTTLATSTPVSLPPTKPPATEVTIEPTPTNTRVLAPSDAPAASPTAIIIVVTATPAPTEPPPPVPTPTPVPPIQPTGSAANDLQALIAYAEAVKPILDEGLAAAERDGAILKASEDNPDALCGGGLTPHPTLAADAALMDDLVNRLKGITPPREASDPVHKPLVESARLWGDALDNINLSCQTDDPAAQGLLRLGAVLQLGGSMLNFRVASDNFWKLVIVNGIEAIVGPAPAR